jgi:L-ascorbate metabolism protein UlaG (beta-lactamase superfamily)
MIICDLMKINETIFWIGHASFYIKAKDCTIFIDPFKISQDVKEKADLILLTHSHFDHTSKEDIDKIRKEETKFIAANKCLEQKDYKHEISKPGFKTKFNGIEIEAIAAYNKSAERLQFHPKSEGWVGYILNIDGTRIYHAGDSDFIEEMKEIGDIEVALLPMGGTYTMTMDEAIDAAGAIKPKTIVPMHYKMILGKEKSNQLESDLKNKLGNVKILKEVQEALYSF